MGIEAVVLTRRSNAVAASAIAPLTATRTNGWRRRCRHESVPHFHTTRLCVSWAKPQESGCNLATSRGNRVFPPDKITAGVTNSGCKVAGSFRKPANPTVGLYLAVARSRASPRGSLVLFRILTLATTVSACQWSARGRTKIVTGTSITVSTRSARCAIDGRRARRQGVGVT